MTATLFQSEIQRIVGAAPTSLRHLPGGCIGEVYRVQFSDGRTMVAKVSRTPEARLGIEGDMLCYLADNTCLPVPKVIYSSDTLLLMEFLEGDSSFSPPAERHAAELLAELHGVQGQAFGFDRDTLIGGLHQPNPFADSWLAFFRDQRLLYMGKEAVHAGRLPQTVFSRLEKLAVRLVTYLHEPEYPSLIHGDVWTTNVLAANGRITGFIDPAVYFAHPEIELAFITLFNTFGKPFFERYHALRPIEPGFFEIRRDIYNLYPLLVHVRLFGGGYVGSVDSILRRLGL